MLKQLSLLSCVSFLYISPAFSQTQGVSLQSLDASPECGPVRQRVDIFASQNPQEAIQSLKVFLDDFSIELEENNPVSRTCQLRAKIVVPPGVQFRPAAAGIKGTATLAPGSLGRVFFSYRLEELDSSTDWEFDLEGFQDINTTIEMEDLRYTPCSTQRQVVTLVSDIDLSIFQYRGGFSSIGLEQNVQDSSIAWDWRSKLCPGTGNNSDFTAAGLYEVTTPGLSCNINPEPCNDASCRITILKAGRLVQASRSTLAPASGKPWLWDQNFSCWVRGSASFLKPLPAVQATDLTQLGASGTFQVTVPGLSCNVTPLPCDRDSCRTLTFSRGETITVSETHNQSDAAGQTRPWFFESTHGCYVRASSKYLRAL